MEREGDRMSYEFETALDKLRLAVSVLEDKVQKMEAKTNQAIKTMKYKAAHNFSQHQQWYDKEGKLSGGTNHNPVREAAKKAAKDKSDRQE
jgi:hypothetical protein